MCESATFAYCPALSAFPAMHCHAYNINLCHMYAIYYLLWGWNICLNDICSDTCPHVCILCCDCPVFHAKQQ